MREIRSKVGRWSCLCSRSPAQLLVLLCLMLGAQTGVGSTGREPQHVDPLDFPKASYHEGLAAVRLGDRYGYIDRIGRVVIAPRFHKAFKFSDGLARVCAPPEHPSFSFRVLRLLGWDDHYAYPCGYIDRTGKQVIDYAYVPAHGFRNGRARVTTPEGKEGYIDHAGRFTQTDVPVGETETVDVVVDAMRSYARAQQRYFARHGRYGPKLSDLSNLPPGMVEYDPARPEADFHGYLFGSVEMNGPTRMDYGKVFLLVSFPALYPVSGRASYAIGPKGIVVAGNSHGDPIYNATQLTAWLPLTN